MLADAPGLNSALSLSNHSNHFIERNTGLRQEWPETGELGFQSPPSKFPSSHAKSKKRQKKRELSKKGIILWSASNERIGATAQQFQIRIPELHNELNFWNFAPKLHFRRALSWIVRDLFLPFSALLSRRKISAHFLFSVISPSLRLITSTSGIWHESRNFFLEKDGFHSGQLAWTLRTHNF